MGPYGFSAGFGILRESTQLLLSCDLLKILRREKISKPIKKVGNGLVEA